LPSFVLALAICFLGWVPRFAHAEEQGTQTGQEEAQAEAATAAGASAAGQASDQSAASAGQAAFERSCTKCHDAARSLERTKDLAGWRATVRRMAGKRGADIDTSDIEPIAAYLASRGTSSAGAAEKPGTAAEKSGTEAKKEQAPAAAPGGDTSSLSAFATLSPQWRGGNNRLQNPGFGPLAWFGANWQGKMVSARVTMCITCHGVQEPGLISRVEPVEAAVRVDLSEWLDKQCHGLKGSIDAGRLIVPFGAFSAQTDPSLYRTVSTPLIFNMGQRIFNQDLGFPVLPMPYADEGVDLNVSVPFGECCTGPITGTVDGYLVNGLIGSSSGLDFLQSRDFFDNNNRVATGGRLTIGDPYVRVGASLTGGRFDDPNTAVVPRGLYYTIWGLDVRAQYKRLFRCQFEFARRDSDRVGTLANGSLGRLSDAVYGYYVEAEARPWEKCRVSLVGRYDSQTHRSQAAMGTLPTGNFDVERFTIGINIEFWQQSLLLINFERWFLPEPTNRTADVFGVRYTITF
jgi:hypothetical protein